MKKKLLFVCLGNICRSPTAEAIMRSYIEKDNLSDLFECDSAGTSGLHEGESADPRSITHAHNRGYAVTSKSRPFIPAKDFKNFDYIIAMDDDNYNDILSTNPNKDYIGKVYRMVQFCTVNKPTKVPDPYYEGPDGFEHVIDILEDACRGLLLKIKSDNNL